MYGYWLLYANCHVGCVLHVEDTVQNTPTPVIMLTVAWLVPTAPVTFENG